jgi:hypothetical protein
MSDDIRDAVQLLSPPTPSCDFDEAYARAAVRAEEVVAREHRRGVAAVGLLVLALVVVVGATVLVRDTDSDRTLDVASPSTTTASPSTTTGDPTARELVFQQDLVASGLPEGAVSHFGDRYGGSRIDVTTFVIYVKGATPADDEWLRAAAGELHTRVEATEFSQAEGRTATQRIIDHLTAAGVAFTVGYDPVSATVKVGVPSPSEDLRLQLQALTDIPVQLVEEGTVSF